MRVCPDESVIVPTYAVQAAAEDAQAMARLLASHFYPGTSGRVAGETDAARTLCAARVLDVREAPSAGMPAAAGDARTFLVQIAIPRGSMGHSMAMLLSNAAGEVLAYGKVRLIDLQLPASLVADFKGPRFGSQGIRKILGIPRRPLLLAITKPCLGFTPEEGARTFFEAAAGGADIVKDDELLSDPGYCRRAARVRLYAEAERSAFDEKGEHTLYTVNITDRPDRLLANALEAIELGANALMMNFLHVGFDAARMVCEDPRVTVPVLGHNAGAVALYSGAQTGVAAPLLSGLFPRLCGLDLAIFLTAHGKFPSSRDDSINTAEEMRGALPGIMPMLPVPAGGVTSALVPAICADYGTDIAMGAGGPLFGNPQGPRAGAAAFRRAIDAVMNEGSTGNGP